MEKAYTLREAYKDVFIGGHVTTGVEGQGVDLQDLLEEGGGEIKTDDPVFQSILENYYGGEGLVFDVHQVDGEERIPVQAVGEGPPIAVGNPAPSVETPPMAGAGTAAATPEAQHGEESEYAKMPVSELRETVRERGIDNPSIGNAKKDELIAMLEADDSQRTANPQ